MVYYRKYRPQTVSELDLKEVREKLTSILSSKEIPHAFLFIGSRGLGKTSSARILAKAINCQNKKGIEPCNDCDICKSITDGSHIDIIEIDAASNRGVDEIRSLREKVKFSPSELSKKVYIIDEVHMLTNEAFNALLKTLEEPPGHVVFILATTEVHKIPQTILSRVFAVKFEKPSAHELTNSLKRIVRGEKLDVDEKVFPKIFELSEGSFRDGAKIIEELNLNSNGKKIDLDLLEKVYRTGSVEKQAEELLEEIYKKDMNASLKIIGKMASEGLDFKTIIERLVEKLRIDLISENPSLKIYDIKELLRLLNEAYATIKLSVLPQLPLELAIMEWSTREELKSQKSEIRNGEKKENIKIVKGSESDDKTNAKSPSGDFLKDLIDVVHKESRQVAAFLRSCKGATVEKNVLVLVTPYSLHAEKLSKQEYREIILKSVFDLDSGIKDLKIITS